MAGNISTQEGALLAGANAVATTREGLTQHNTQIRGAVGETRGSWDGPSAVRFEQLTNAWEEEVRKLNRTLDHFEGVLRETLGAQERDEEENASDIGGIGSVMAG